MRKLRLGTVIVALVAALACVPGALSAPPTNDNFAAADPITGASGTDLGSVAFATHESGEPFHAGERGTGSVWYAWTAPGDLRANFDACGTGGDTLLAAYVGTTLDTLTPVASDKDGCRLGRGLDFDAVAGQTYRIAADPTAPRTSIQLNWSTGPLIPRNLTPPTISGPAVTNGVLVASPGTWAHATSFLYSWYSCPPEGPAPIRSCRHILLSSLPAGPASMRVTADLRGQRIRAQVGATGPNGINAASSALTAPVTLGPPLNTSPPSVEGYTVVGETLEATEGEWDLGGAERQNVTYLWQRCDANIENCRDVKGPGADNKYHLTSADRGSFVQAVVTLTTTGGSTSASGIAQGEVTPRVRVAPQRRCVVPRLVGKSLKAARKSLSDARCRLGSVRRTTSTRRAGVILAQRPKAGLRLRSGGRVNVLVSKGRRR